MIYFWRQNQMRKLDLVGEKTNFANTKKLIRTLKYEYEGFIRH